MPAEAGKQVGGAPARAPERADARVPDFFLVGHEKCGTTALYRILRSHPQIFMPDVKEPRFFASDYPPSRTDLAARKRIKTPEDYLALFAPAHPDQRAGEASPQYIRSPTAAAEIAAMQPDARIVAIVREPVSFLRSYHLQCVRSGIETQRSLEKAIALEAPRRSGRKVPRGCVAPLRLLYSEHVRYVEQLQRFSAVFAPEQVLVLVYDDFRRENEATARAVVRFLGVDADAPLELSSRAPQDRKAVRSTRLNSLATDVARARRGSSASRASSRVLGSLMPRALDPVFKRVVRVRAEPLDERFASELRRRFKPEVVALGEYLDRDLVTLWGYDSIS